MHFYYFLYIFYVIFHRFHGFFLCFPCCLLYLLVTPSGVEPSHANRGEWCAAAILTDRQQPKNKNTWIMIFYSSRIVIRDNSLST